MTDSITNRAGRRAAAARAKTAAVAGTAVAAMALGVAGAPAAQGAIDVNVTWYPTYTSGALADILNLVGNLIPGQDLQLNDSFSYSSGPPQSVGLSISAELAGFAANVNAALNLKNIPGDAKNLYTTAAATPQQGGCTSASTQSTCRYILQLATSQAVMNLIDAYRNEISSVQGNTPAGLIPFTAAPNATAAQPSRTNQGLIFLQNPLRPNGGIAARFPEISKALGIDPAMPAAGKFTSSDGKVAVNSTTLDLTWAYDPIGDFPAVFNPTAMINSAMAGLPLNIIDGLADEPIQGSSLTDIGLNLGAVLQFPTGISLLPTLGMADGQAFYSTLVPNLMPILVPAVLPGTLINFGLKALGSPFLLGNPFVDVMNPVMKILVNTGYTDVLSPTKLNTCIQDCYTANPKSWKTLGYSAYDRTFGYSPANPATPTTAANPATFTPFGSVDTLTPEEQKAVPGDAWNAFTTGVKAQLAKPYWGVLVPNEAKSAAATPAAAVPAPAASTIAPQQVSAPEAPTAPAPVASDPAPEIDLVVADDPAPVALPAASRGGDDAPAATGHRGGGSSSSDDSDAPKGRHRGSN